MEIIDTADLAPTPRAEIIVCDPKTGSRLFGDTDPISSEDIEDLIRLGISRVALLMPGESLQTVLRNSQFEPLDRSKIKPGMTIAFDVYDADGNVLLARGATLSQSIMTRLSRRRIHKIFIRRPPDPEHARRLHQAQALLQRRRSSKTPSEVRFSSDELVELPSHMTTRSVQDMAKTLETTGGMQIKLPEDTDALAHFIQFVNSFRERKRKTKEYYIQLYHRLIDQTRRIYQALDNRTTVNGQLIMAMVEQAISALVSDHALLLCTIYIPASEDDYLPHHAVNVSILAVNIAAAAGFSTKQVHEIGYGALLADVGMLSVPRHIRFKQNKLSSDEHLEIMRHTLYGIDRLQQVYHLPKTAPLVGYQSHERLDGSGYPHNKKSHGIHDFAKIVAIADIFNAQIARRPFRPEGRLPYAAIEEVLRMTSAKKLDSSFVRSLLASVSLFPVGSWVRLNIGKDARVIGANADLFTRPIVNILYDAQGQPCDPQRVNLAENSEIHVVSPIAIRSSDPMEGF